MIVLLISVPVAAIVVAALAMIIVIAIRCI